VQLNRAHNVNGDGVLYHTLARATRVSRDLRICSADKTPPFRDHCRCYAWVSNRAVGDSTLSVFTPRVRTLCDKPLVLSRPTRFTAWRQYGRGAA